jgi:predicted RND superfamily exporter protein
MVALLIASWSLLGLRVDTSIGSALNRTDQSWKIYQRSLDLFGGDEFVAVALAPSAEPLASSSLAAVLDLTERFEALPSIRRVDSLSTVPLVRTLGDGSLSVSPGLTREVAASGHARRELLDYIRNDRIAPGSLVSNNERVLALNLVFDGDVDGDREFAVAEIRRALAEYDESAISGVPVVRADAGVRTRQEVLLFIPLTVLLVGIVLIAVFQQALAVIVPMAVGGSCTVICLGVMAAVGVPLSFSTAVLPSIVFALACAYTMHIMTAAAGAADPESLIDSIIVVSGPVALSGLTTTIGFLAMSISRIGLIRDLAGFGALGAILVTIGSMTLAPALVAVSNLPTNSRSSAHGVQEWVSQALASRLSRFVLSYSRQIVAVWGLGLALVGIGLLRLSVTSDVILWFPPSSELRTSYETIRERLSGITPVNVLFEAVGDRLVTTPEALALIDSLSNDLGAHPSVGKVLSVADPIRLIHREFSDSRGGDMPADQSLIDQYLLLLDGVEQMDDVLARDRTSGNVLLRMDKNSSSDIVSLATWIDLWWERNGIPGYRTTTTGIMYEFGRAQDEIAYGGIRGLLIAMAAIAVILIVVFETSSVAFIALVANVAPIGILFGIIGWIRVPLDAVTVCTASLAIGIAVDDTIHVVSQFAAMRGLGASPAEALEQSLSKVLPALVFTTAAIFLGFGVLVISEFSLVRNLGIMMSAAVMLCLLADCLLLPALLLRGSDRGDGHPS